MELKWMRSFVVVAEELHVTRAAERLHLAQSAVSQHLALLERELGVRLLHRTSRQMTLTSAGVAFLDRCRGVLDAVDAASHAARALGSDEIGRLRVAYNAGFAARLLTALVAACLDDAPALEVAVDGTSTNRVIVDAVRRERVDIGLFAAEGTPPAMPSMPVGRVRLQLLAPAVEGLPPRVDAAALRGRRCILPARADGFTLRGFALTHLAARGVEAPRVLDAGDGITVERLVAAGLGVGFTTSGTLVAGAESGAVSGASPSQSGAGIGEEPSSPGSMQRLVSVHELVDAPEATLFAAWSSGSIAGAWAAQRVRALRSAET